MHSPTNVQEVHKLNGRLASLSRFLPKLVEKVKLFYKLLNKIEPFMLDETWEQTFLACEKAIATLSVLSRPRLGVLLLLYLVVPEKIDSSTFVQEEGKY